MDTSSDAAECADWCEGEFRDPCRACDVENCAGCDVCSYSDCVVVRGTYTSPPIFLNHTTQELRRNHVFYYTDGSRKTWDWMERSCKTKGKRLCAFEEICPDGHGCPPIGGQQSSTDMWVPVYSENKDWVQVGTRDGGMCNVHDCHSGWPTDECCCGNWCHTEVDQEWKRIYACCEGPVPTGTKDNCYLGTKSREEIGEAQEARCGVGLKCVNSACREYDRVRPSTATFDPDCCAHDSARFPS